MMPQYAPGTLAKNALKYYSSEFESEPASFCHCTHHYLNDDDDVLVGRDRLTVEDALHDSTRCLLTETNLANEICRTVDA